MTTICFTMLLFFIAWFLIRMLWFLLNYKRQPFDKLEKKEWEYWEEQHNRGNPKMIGSIPALSIKDRIMVKIQSFMQSRHKRKQKQKAKVKKIASPIQKTPRESNISLENLIDGELPDQIYTNTQESKDENQQ